MMSVLVTCEMKWNDIYIYIERERERERERGMFFKFDAFNVNAL